MNKEYITLTHFKKLLTAQPFFVWNKLEDIKKDYDLSPEESAIQYFEDNNKTFLNSWTHDIQKLESVSFGQIYVKTYYKYNQYLHNILYKEFDCIITKGTKEERIAQTTDALKGNKMILYPVFEYKNSLAEPFAFDVKTKTIINLKYSKKTKLMDSIPFFWHDGIISEHIKIKKHLLFLPVDKETYKKGEIDIYCLNVIQRTKSPKTPLEQNASGNTTDVLIKEMISNTNYFDYDIDDYIAEIIEAKKIKKPDTAHLRNDNERFGPNPDFLSLVETLGFDFPTINGNVIPKTKIVEYFNIVDSNDKKSHLSSIVFDEYLKIDKTKINKKKIQLFEKLKKRKNVIWYDFEGYSLPTSPFDGVKPFSQLIFQVSVIQTLNNEEVFCENTVIDPKNINLDFLYSMIEKVYHDKADAYVVYNKAYEIPRMKDIINLLWIGDHPKIDIAQKMLDHIELNTFDLMDLFKINSKNKIPPIFLSDQNCKASIKNIEKHISQNNIKLPRPIKEYKNLDVQNGLMAMEAAINRALNLTGDIEWDKKVISLKEYCENDVRAMIMVYDFVEYLVKK